MFRDAHTDGRTHARTGQKQYAAGHTTLDGGIKIDIKMKLKNVEQKNNNYLQYGLIIYNMVPRKG